jgi:phosphatidylserine/phosphatidylglycerophosphate/cardiolipin synthase-like enzyme
MDDDCDVMLLGPAASEISDVFRDRWSCLELAADDVDIASPPACTSLDIETEACLSSPVLDLNLGFWDDEHVFPMVLYSSPGHLGVDPIFRASLQMLREAKDEFRMCMGWSCLSAPFIAECIAAVDRGVRVQLLLNSRYSADLCVPQRDLMLSVAALFRHSSDVEVYLTFPQPPTRSRDCSVSDNADLHEFFTFDDDEYTIKNDSKTNDTLNQITFDSTLAKTSFVHAKYCVADGEILSVGSWNLWPRSSFYEHECNVLLRAPNLATRVEKKFEHAKIAYSSLLIDPTLLTPGGLFTPLGCSICTPFGPCLYTDELIEMATRMARLRDDLESNHSV